MPNYFVKLSSRTTIDLSFEEYKKLAQVLAIGTAKFVILNNRVINTAFIIALDYEPFPYERRTTEEETELKELKGFFQNLGSHYPQLENGSKN